MKNHWQKMGALALGMALALAFAPCLPASAVTSCTQTDLQHLANNITSFGVSITSATPMDVPFTTIAFCDVRGNITTEVPTANTVEFELGLPASFNGRLLFRGGGGFNGYIPTPTAATNQFSPAIPHLRAFRRSMAVGASCSRVTYRTPPRRWISPTSACMQAPSLPNR